MKDRKKQAVAVVMATTLALTTATATSATSVYAQEADEATQTESIISDGSNTETQETDTTVDEETTEDTETSAPAEDGISDEGSEDESKTSDSTINSSVQKAMIRSIENDEDNGISAQAEGDVEINETNFPDNTFRSYVKTNFDTSKDGFLSEEEINAVTEINVNGKTAITSLQGIEHFPALIKLNCKNTGIASLDVSKNTALENLLCNNTNITSLDVSSNLSLRELNCQSTKITSIEGLEQLVSLKYLYCNDTAIKELDISKNILLENLYCYNTNITELDVSKNTALKDLRCYNTSISELDISNNTALNYLYCYSTNITELDVSQNTALKYLFCDDTNITELDVSKNTALQYLSCYDTAIIELDVSKNTALEYLACYNTSITELNVSNNTALRTLYCYKTDITELDVSNNKKLTGLYIYNTSITSIDLSQNEALTTLDCDSTPIMELDVSNNKKLSYLTCRNSNLTSLDVSQNTALTILSCSNTNLAYLNIGDNGKLTYVAKNNTSTFNITDKVGSSFDITEIFEGIDTSKITIKSDNVTITDEGIVSGYTTNNPVVVYEYDCGTANGTEHTLTITLNLTLKDSRTITWNENSLNKTYDKEPVAITESAYSVSAGNGDVSFSYQKQNADGTWEDMENAPVSAGTYRVKATVAENEDYMSATTDWENFTISQATNSWIDDISITDWTYEKYDEDKNAPSATAKYGEATYTYSDSENGNFTEDVPTEAGTWYVKATVAETSNYTELTATKSFVIEQAVPQFDMPNNLTATYGDTLSRIEFPEYDNGTLKWKNDTQFVRNAGTNTFEAVFTPNDNNYKTVTVNVSVNVRKAIPVYTAPTGIVIGQGKTLDTVALTNGFSWKDGNTVASELGTHSFEAIYTPDDTDNYETVELTISVEVVPVLTPVNQIPSITAEDKTITVGDTFNPLDGVTATDTEDGDLTDGIEIISNDVDTSKAGTYTVTYKVTDSQGASSTKIITVTVKEKEDTNNPSDEQKPNDKTDNSSNNGNTTKPTSTDKTNTNKTTSPKTGDSSNIGLYTSLLAMSGLLIAILAVLRKKKVFGRK